MRRSAASSLGSIRARPPHAEPGQRIGLLGGSFNPPHAAHKAISELALRRLGLDRVWWIVTPGNPLKSHRELLPLDVRVTLAKKMAADPRIVVTDFEKLLGTTFTAATIAFLMRRQPGVHFVWLMGADCLAEFDRWRHWRQIFRALPIAVADRPGWRLRALASKSARAFSRQRLPEERARNLALKRPPCWCLLSGRLMQLSSTAIRAKASRQSSE
ncbi:MAG: nicotinate-nucleotide adenylyltransferase [Hyphomicrobiaceae bacterium]